MRPEKVADACCDSSSPLLLRLYLFLSRREPESPCCAPEGGLVGVSWMRGRALTGLSLTLFVKLQNVSLYEVGE